MTYLATILMKAQKKFQLNYILKKVYLKIDMRDTQDELKGANSRFYIFFIVRLMVLITISKDFIALVLVQ